MTVKSRPVVYLTPSTDAEKLALSSVLEVHSWAAGEFGLMLTDTALADSIAALPADTEPTTQRVLARALDEVKRTGAGDVCLNFGIVNSSAVTLI